MANQYSISCHLESTAPGLLFTASVDDAVWWHGDPWGGHEISVTLDDSDGSHVLTFDLMGKTSEHTKIDDAGNILQDVTVSISKLSFDQVPLGQVMVEQAVYSHDYNGTKPAIDEQFYGTMGCNGRVSLGFTTPIYLWLLDNL